MAYTELNCDDIKLTVQELIRRSMKQLPDGTWTIQTVDVSAMMGGDFNSDFNNDFNI